MAAEVGDQNDAVAKERDAGASGHQAFLQLDVGDTAFVDAGVVRGGDSLGDSVSVFAQGSGETDGRSQSAVCEVVQLSRYSFECTTEYEVMCTTAQATSVSRSMAWRRFLSR